MTPQKSEIVVYQPNETLRLEVRLQGESIWLPQQRIADLFGVQKAAISKHLKNTFASGELVESATVSKMETVQVEGSRRVTRQIDLYNLDAIIAVGYRVNSHMATQFRIWATQVLKAYLLKGYAFNARLNQLEDKMDRRFFRHEAEIVELKDKVDFFVQTQTPPIQGVFYDGQLWDACSLVERLVARARASILLIDSWVGVETLDLLAKKRKGVSVTVVTSEHKDRRGKPRPTLAETDIAKFNAQYPSLTVRYSEKFHDRFLILDDEEIYLIGASLKDLGKKCFAFTKLDAGEIAGLKARVSSSLLGKTEN